MGFARTSVAEVARRAGVSKGVVTYHFPSKDELLTRVVTELYARAGERIERHTEAAGGGWAAVEAYLAENLAFVREHSDHVRAAMEVVANLRRPDGSLAFAAPGDDPILAHLEDLLASSRTRKRPEAVDIRSLAIIVRSAIDTAAVRGATDSTFDHAAYVGTLRATVAGALGVPA